MLLEYGFLSILDRILGWAISPSQILYMGSIHIDAGRHSWFELDSKQRSGVRATKTHSQTARPLWLASLILIFKKYVTSVWNTYKYHISCSNNHNTNTLLIKWQHGSHVAAMLFFIICTMKFHVDVMSLGVCPKIVISDFLKSIIPIWRTNKLVRWDRQ
jgi:hypothetical protein